MSILGIILSAILTDNFVLSKFMGCCPFLGVSKKINASIGMGAAVCAVLTCSNLFISLIRKIVPKQIRIASYIVVISGFVTAVELLIKAFLPAIDASLGLFIPLIVVNCIILARAEAFASKNPPIPSMIDGIATGIGFTFALVCIAFVRELLGTGKILAAADGTGGVTVFGSWYPGASIFLLPAGAFLTLGFIIALVHKISDVSSKISANRRHKAALCTAALCNSEDSVEAESTESSAETDETVVSEKEASENE